MTASDQARFGNAVASICRSVQSLGIDVTPSLLKSAADGGDVVRSSMNPVASTYSSHMHFCHAMQSALLGRSLHDLVILILAGFPSSGDLLLHKFWEQIELENITPGLPTEGKLCEV